MITIMGKSAYFYLGAEAETIAPPIEVTGPAQADEVTIETGGVSWVQPDE